jgi:phosphoribosylamine--glycine ligase
MKVLVIDADRVLLDLCMRAQDAGHEVRWWMPPLPTGESSPIGNGYFKKLKEWESSARWADLIVMGDNAKYAAKLAPFFNKGFPIFGCNAQAAALELDRGHGQEVCSDYGMDTLPYVIMNSYDDALKHVEKTMETFVSKPWGGDADKSLSYVSSSPEDMVWKLNHWKKTTGRLKGQIMLQKRVKGTEMAVGGWFSRGGWAPYVCENFEEKKFMNDGLGQNTGEQGTTLRYTEKSKLFNLLLEPLTGHLHKIGYVGYVDQNAIIQPNGKAWPLELTMRFGYPLNYIQEALHLGDPVNWMYEAAVEGKNTLKVSKDIAVGVVLSHGKYPNQEPMDMSCCGTPLYGMTTGMVDHIHLVEAQWGSAPMTVNGKIKEVPIALTAGCYIACVTGTGEKVSDARDAAYKRIWKIKPPTNRMFRTDIGARLEEEIPLLQSNGYAEGMKY